MVPVERTSGSHTEALFLDLVVGENVGWPYSVRFRSSGSMCLLLTAVFEGVVRSSVFLTILHYARHEGRIVTLEALHRVRY